MNKQDQQQGVHADLSRLGLEPPAAVTESAVLLARWWLALGFLQTGMLGAWNNLWFATQLRMLMASRYGWSSLNTSPGPSGYYWPPFTPMREYWRTSLSLVLAPFTYWYSKEFWDRYLAMLDSLNRLLSTHLISVRFSNYTGLVRTLRGELDTAQAWTKKDRQEAANRFLETHEVALLGTEGNHWCPDAPPAIGPVARFRQTDRDGIPVYGATVACGFNKEGRITFIDNAWYPMPADTSWQPQRDESDEEKVRISQDEAAAIAEAHVRARDGAKRSSLPADLIEVPADMLKAGQVIFPYLGRASCQYRPAWAMRVIDRTGAQSWEVIVDAQSRAVLAESDAMCRAPLTAYIYPHNACALEGTCASVCLVNEGCLAHAPHFALSGPGFKEPPQGPCPTQPDQDHGLHSANVYYHLCRAMQGFEQIFTLAWKGVVPLDLLPGKGERMPVSVGENFTHYNPTAAGTKGQLVFTDAATLDCEVIKHEYTHAVNHIVQPGIQDPNSPSDFNRAIDEGLAIYYGCTLSEHPPSDNGYPQPTTSTTSRSSVWAEKNYPTATWYDFFDLRRAEVAQQKPGYDYLPVYGTYPDYDGNLKPPNNIPEFYACGTLLARALWDIRQVLGYELADAIILRGLSLTAGGQSELETLAEAIIHADSDVCSSGPTHAELLRLIFCSRGIMGDNPIHDLATVEIGEETFELAATEGTAQNGTGPGCWIRRQGATSWQPLGTNCQGVRALAVVKLDAGHAVILAASEQRDEGSDGKVSITTEVKRYDLPDNAAQDWQPLGAWPDPQRRILSLAAARQAGSGLRLFAGTDQGLYFYDTATTQWSQLLKNLIRNEVCDLMVIENPKDPENPPRFLLVADFRKGPFVVKLTDLTSDTNYRKYGLTAVTVAGAVDVHGKLHLWVGTAMQGLHHYNPYNPDNRRWDTDTPLKKQIIYSLLLDTDNSEPRLKLAGTNNGVFEYQRTGQGHGSGPETWKWQPSNTTADQFGATIAHSSVVALCQAGNEALAGTTWRGLWARQADEKVWTQQSDGLPRVSGLNDALGKSTKRLHAGSVGTHIYYVPEGTNSDRELTVTFEGDCQVSLQQPNDAFSVSVTLKQNNVANTIGLQLFYVATHTDPKHGHGAGLQQRDWLQPNASTQSVQAPARESGYYVLVVKPIEIEDSGVSYTLKVTLA